MIVDKVLRNELKQMNEDDPSLFADMEEAFKAAGIREAFELSQNKGDPRHLIAAMKASETFHCTFRFTCYRPLPLFFAFPAATTLFYLWSFQCRSPELLGRRKATTWH